MRTNISVSIPDELIQEIDKERGLVNRSVWVEQRLEKEKHFRKIMPVKEKADRKFIEDVIDLHEQGKDVEQIMFSLDLPYEEPEDE